MLVGERRERRPHLALFLHRYRLFRGADFDSSDDLSIACATSSPNTAPAARKAHWAERCYRSPTMRRAATRGLRRARRRTGDARRVCSDSRYLADLRSLQRPLDDLVRWCGRCRLRAAHRRLREAAAGGETRLSRPAASAGRMSESLDHERLSCAGRRGETPHLRGRRLSAPARHSVRCGSRGHGLRSVPRARRAIRRRTCSSSTLRLANCSARHRSFSFVLRGAGHGYVRSPERGRAAATKTRISRSPRSCCTTKRSEPSTLCWSILGRNDLGRVRLRHRCGRRTAADRALQPRHAHRFESGRRLRAEVATALDLFKAGFPAGTVTGTPRFGRCNSSTALEPVPADFTPAASAAGRSAATSTRVSRCAACTFATGARVAASAGIVADSEPVAESRGLHKTRIARAVLGIE